MKFERLFRVIWIALRVSYRIIYESFDKVKNWPICGQKSEKSELMQSAFTNLAITWPFLTDKE
jgi:hypothetical protein